VPAFATVYSRKRSGRRESIMEPFPMIGKERAPLGKRQLGNTTVSTRGRRRCMGHNIATYKNRQNS